MRSVLLRLCSPFPSGYTRIDASGRTRLASRLPDLKRLASALLPVQVVVDPPAAVYDVPGAPVHKLGEISFRPPVAAHIGEVVLGDEPVSQVPSAPEDRLDMEPKRGVGQSAHLAVDRELVVELQHQAP